MDATTSRDSSHGKQGEDTHLAFSDTEGRHTPPGDTTGVLNDPAFKELVRERSAFAWTLSILMLVVYLAFILLVAFAHDLMATAVGGGPTSLGILFGLAVILFAFVLTGVYVVRANGRFDQLTARIMKGR